MLSQEETILCPNCEQNIDKSKYFLHERMCSLNVKKCPKCNKPFNVDDLNDHINLVHSFTTCNLCNNKFPYSEIEEHKKNCLFQLIPCKFCELNVLLKELEEHEAICGSTTEKCLKCGLYIEKRNYANHVCLEKETKYFNENLIIDKEEDMKKEKKRIKSGLEKNTKKKNKVFVDLEVKNIKKEKKYINNIINKDGFFENEPIYNQKKNKNKGGGKKNQNKIKQDNKEDFEIKEMDFNDFYTPDEIKSQIKEFNRLEKLNYINNLNNNNDIKQNKKKKNKKKDKEKEDEKEFINQNEIKIKKGKKNKNQKNLKNKINKDEEDNKYFDDEEYYNKKKNNDLHSIKWDIPPEKYKNYNNTKNYDYGFDYNLEEKMLQEAIKLSLKEK